MDVFNSISMTHVAASLAAAAGIEPPHNADAPIDWLTAALTAKGTPDRVLIHNPDACGQWIWQRYTDYFAPVAAAAPLAVPIATVMPSVTPVCFASMYTGASPEIHGIRFYSKPVLTTDTLFDSLVRAGKRVAIIAVENCSIDRIFRGREIDYFSFPYELAVAEKAKELISRDEYDWLTVYTDSYDSVMHKNGPEAAVSLEALRSQTDIFAGLVSSVREHWRDHTTLIGFLTDHGVHEIDGGCGSHGLYMPEDINVVHFYGLI